MKKEQKEEKENNSKKSLIICILLIFISLILLVGVSYAWFTDNASSGINKIEAGSLDIELLYAPLDAERDEAGNILETEWKTVGETDSLFKASDDTLWEPGHTEMAFLRVKNNGTLTLKYDFKINAFGTADGGEEKTYVNVLNNEFKLSEYLILNSFDGVDERTRTECWIENQDEENAALGKLSSSSENLILAPGSTKDITLVVYMPKSVDNKANQLSSNKVEKGEPELYLGIDLVATQASQEADSFGNDYDANIN